MRRKLPMVVFAALIAPFAFADSLVLTNRLKYDEITITGVDGDQLRYTFKGNATAKPISQIARLTVTAEPAFNAAEEAFAAGDWEKAIEGYDRAMKSNTAWVKDWSSQRLMDAANKGGRFDAAAKAFIALAEKSPDAARTVKLNMPAANSAFLTDAIKETNAALTRKIADPSKEVLLDFLIELNNARNDSKAAADALTRRMQLRAADPNSPEGQRAAAMLKLQGARIALTAKEYDKVIQTIEREGNVLVEPADQAEALYLLAEAKNAKASNSPDPAIWKDVALAYMRVVANAPTSSPQVPVALLKVAAIHDQRLNEKKAALALYEQIASEYKGQDAAKQAAQEAARLK